MAHQSDKNGKPCQEENGKDEKPIRPSASGTTELEQGRQSRPRERQSGPRPRRDTSPTTASLTSRALRLSRQFLQQRGRRLMELPLGQRVLVVADKALGCVIQALRWAGVPPVNVPITEGVVLPPEPLGLSLREPIETLLHMIGSAVRMAAMFLRLHIPENEELMGQLMSYRRELEELRMVPGRPPRAQSPEVQRSTALAGSNSSAIPQPRTATPSESSSTSSSSGSTAPITEEMVQRYFSPPHFSTVSTKREKEKGDGEEEKHLKDDERKDSETQQDDPQRQATTAEKAEGEVLSVGQPSTSSSSPPSESSLANDEGGPQPEASGARRPSTKFPKPSLFMNLLGVKIA
ncbi:protein AF-9-like isoform X1 [Schistocerca cancellata]|uniref:protein AF-9-like isoform X1 n=1 Tax=Schistocerca cancellata TaxID=274614 RepID=UPI0021199D56|nr:protein AF-9-like isoform X1 [Schistocerca cancellata]